MKTEKGGLLMLALYTIYLEEDKDKKLLEKLYNTYRKQMICVAMCVLHSETDAEDAVHTVFLNVSQKCWKTVSGIKEETDMRYYLLRATKNTALNMVYAENKKTSLDTVVERGLESIPNLSDDDFVENICNKMEYESVVNAIANLEGKYREAMYWHFVLEISIPETARRMNQSVVATKKQLVRGKKMLLSSIKMKGDGNYVN